MKKLSFKISVVLQIFLVACASGPELSPEAQKIKVGKADPDSKCEEVAVITANTMFGCDQECQRKTLRKKAFEKGANYIRLDLFTTPNAQAYQPGETTATAFKCP